MKLKRIGILAIIAALLVASVVWNSKNTLAYALDENINSLMEDIKIKAYEDPATAMSSNPYDYTHNAYFEKIISLGPNALPLITKMIDTSKSNGLKEYILAIAAEKIAKVDFKENNMYGWETAKEWTKKWNIHLSSIPKKVETIINSNTTQNQKEIELKKLGLPAIPYIKEMVKNSPNKFDINSLKTWDNSSDNEISNLKNLVEKNQ